MNDLSLKNIDWLSFLIVILPFGRVIKFLPDIPVFIYYGVLLLAGIICFSKGENRFNKTAIFFIFFCAVSLISNYVDPRYKAWERLFSLCCIILAVGPLFTNRFADLTRKNCIKYACWLSIIICLISFVLFFTAKSLTYTERGNLYGGITVHSMTLSPIAAIGFIYTLQYYFNKQKSMRLFSKITCIIVILICLFNCVVAGSRSALLSLIIASLSLLWFLMRNNKRLFFKYLSIITLSTVLTTPLWWKYTETIQSKMEFSESQGSLLTTRQGKWDARVEEIKKNPIVGYGFGTVDAPVSEKGTVEPGNGWLFVWSSSGIFAFICFCLVYYRSFYNCINNKNNLSYFLFALLVFFALHLNAEGYSISSGNVLCFILWLCLGIAYNLKYKYK